MINLTALGVLAHHPRRGAASVSAGLKPQITQYLARLIKWQPGLACQILASQREEADREGPVGNNRDCQRRGFNRGGYHSGQRKRVRPAPAIVNPPSTRPKPGPPSGPIGDPAIVAPFMGPPSGAEGPAISTNRQPLCGQLRLTLQGLGAKRRGWTAERGGRSPPRLDRRQIATLG